MVIKNFFFFAWLTKMLFVCLVNGDVLGHDPIGLYLVNHVVRHAVCHAVCPYSMSHGLGACLPCRRAV
uniref:Putative secreted protein n=1 Tax=Ixodes ricinus TaxID=34613 RepID=A0A147BJZ5_IXORI